MKRQSHLEKLTRLADALAEEVLSAPDDEILSEAEGEFSSVQDEAGHVLGILEKAKQQAAKRRLYAAKEAIAQYKNQTMGKVIILDPAAARRKLDQILKEHPESTQEFTLAARKGRDLSDSDVLSMLEDLQELGLYDPNTHPQDGK